MSEDDCKFDLNFEPKPRKRCKNCNRLEDQHRAKDKACPIGRGNFPQWNLKQSFENKRSYNKKSKGSK